MQDSGHATISALHLRDARDAQIVFEAVRLNILQLVTRRLTSSERDQLKSGNVFVWEEAEHKQGGLERWTDGRRWSQSRMRGDYLFYEEKVETTPEEKAAKAARRARRTLDPFAYQPTPTRQDRPSKPNGLTKQTFSTHVHSHQAEPRKWHIVAYFSGDDYTHLPVVENYEFLRNLRVPEGIFAPAKGSMTRMSRMLAGADGHAHAQRADELSEWATPGSWALTPTSPGHARYGASTDRPLSSSSSSSSSTGLDSSPYTLTHSPGGTSPLPRLSNVVTLHIESPTRISISAGRPHASYSALTSED
ncbi:Gti1/Pac2 family-domain-containing protein, partial [Amylocystis lapponica]